MWEDVFFWAPAETSQFRFWTENETRVSQDFQTLWGAAEVQRICYIDHLGLGGHLYYQAPAWVSTLSTFNWHNSSKALNRIFFYHSIISIKKKKI